MVSPFTVIATVPVAFLFTLTIIVALLPKVMLPTPTDNDGSLKSMLNSVVKDALVKLPSPS